MEVKGGCRWCDSPMAEPPLHSCSPPIQQTGGMPARAKQANAEQWTPVRWLLKFVGITSHRQTAPLCKGRIRWLFHPSWGVRSSRYLRVGHICLLKSLLYFSFECLVLFLRKKSLALPWKTEWLLVIFCKTFLSTAEPIWAWLGFTNRLEAHGVLQLEFKILIESKTLTGEMDAQITNYISLPFSLYFLQNK